MAYLFLSYTKLLLHYNNDHIFSITSIGQFWNVPIWISEFTGTLFDPLDVRSDRYTVTVQHPASPQRRFTAILQNVDWEFNRIPCFFAGNQQGGSVYEVSEPNDSVIEGFFEDYQVSGSFDTQFPHSRFADQLCSI